MPSDKSRDPALGEKEDGDDGDTVSLPQQRFTPEEEAVSCYDPLPTLHQN